MEVDSGAVTAAVTDFTEEAVVGSMAEAMETMPAPVDTTVAITATAVDIMDTTVDTMVTIGIMAMATTAAAGGIRGSSVLDGVIRGTGIRTMGVGIPIMVIMIRTTLTPATTEIPATTRIPITTTRITTGIMAPRPMATPGILTTDTEMESATVEGIMRIRLEVSQQRPSVSRPIVLADQVNGGAPRKGAPL